MKILIDRIRSSRAGNLLVANVRILLGFAFVPAGLKKVLYQRFTEVQNGGPFHDFLDAFYATGAFYQFVGAIQLLAAVLLMAQTSAFLGALIALPAISCITVFCWSTGVIPTAIVASMMLLATLALIVWDIDRWLPILWPATVVPRTASATRPLIDLRLWRASGVAILAFYGISCLAFGGVYRPKGMDLGSPAFYVLPLILLFPIATWIVEERQRSAG